jgi:enamine deaminase RidA (YjgF/YER057c/UK114 family)
VVKEISMDARPEQKLIELGIALPAAPKPLGAYVPAVAVGSLLYLSGALPLEGGAPVFRGRIGGELSVEKGRAATRLAALNALALARAHLGSLDKVTGIVRLTVWLLTTPDFIDHAKVADGASELLAGVFGKDKASTRMVAGVVSLPAGGCTVVEMILSM